MLSIFNIKANAQLDILLFLDFYLIEQLRY